ncbi:MAG: COR domain-containing protein [Gallionellaceae bacterium]
MRPVPHDFQTAINEAKRCSAKKLSLHGDKDTEGHKVLFEVPQAVLAYNPLEAIPERPGLILDSGQYARLAATLDARNIIGLKFRRGELPLLENWLAAGGPLAHLEYLDLSDTLLLELPEVVCALTNLTSLDLSQNGLSQLPDAIRDLKNLTSLTLWGNKLSQLPDAIHDLRNLTSLDLSHNGLSQLPDAIRDLKNLTSLDLNHNGLSQLPDAIRDLKNLTSLNLSGNGLSQLPDAILDLRNLTSLDLSDNDLSQLPDAIHDLKNLTSLTLWGNKLSQLPDAIRDLRNLTWLDLSDNDLSQLPDAIHDLRNLTSLDLSDNPIQTPPPFVIDGGILAIQEYFRQASAQGGTIPLYEARILIVGEAGAGKTTLMKKLLDQDYQLPKKGENSTLGIQVERNWRFPYCADSSLSFQAHIWDFGGQEIQYMTHQFFLRDRSLYVLVCDERKQDADFDYWFKVIHLMGQGSPVLVMANERNYKSVSNFDLAYYQKLYPDLSISQCNVDFGKSNDGRLLELIAAIQQGVCGLKHIGEQLPKQWIPIREALATQQPRHHISFSEFSSICREQGVEGEQSVLLISDYLDALGLIVHFRDDPALYDFVIVDPQWVVDAIYAVLEDKTVQQQNGYFNQQWIFDRWKDKGYSHEECCKLISLMEADKFEICYAVKDGAEQRYVVPQLLPNVVPRYEWNPQQNLQFRLNYPFMPKGIMARLIVRLNEFVLEQEQPLIWKRGMVLVERDCRAEISQQADSLLGGESIYIRVNGADWQRKELLARIRNELGLIQRRSFPNLTVHEYIPCCGTACAKSEEPRFFKLSDIEKIISNRRDVIYCDECNDDIVIGALLGGVLSEGGKHDGLIKLLKEKGLSINVNQHVEQRQEAHQTTHVAVSVEIQIVNEFAGCLGMLKEDLLDEIDDGAEKQKIEKTIGKVEKAVADLKAAPPEQAKKNSAALTRLKDFVEQLHNAEGTLGKAVAAVDGGLGHAKKLAQLYNKIAPWAGLPSVPLV